MTRPRIAACTACGAVSLGLAGCPCHARAVVLDFERSSEPHSTHLATALVLLCLAWVAWEYARDSGPPTVAAVEAQPAWCER